MFQCHHKGPSLKRRLNSLDPNAKVVKLEDAWMTSERQINSLPGLLAVKMLPTDQQNVTNRLTHQSIPSLTSGGNDELEPNTADFRVDHNL